MTTETKKYLAFVDVPHPNYGYCRCFLQTHTPGGITTFESNAKQYTRYKDAEKAAKWFRENIRPNYTNGLDYQSKDKKAGVLFVSIIETREETIL